jgi:hypothetical protein
VIYLVVSPFLGTGLLCPKVLLWLWAAERRRKTQKSVGIFFFFFNPLPFLSLLT